jgi:hypothetical protein
VVPRATQADKASWEYVSQNSEPAEVLTFLEQNNLFTLNLDLMAWRLKDADFAKKALAHLRSRHHWHPTTWSYALLLTSGGVTDYLCTARFPRPLRRMDRHGCGENRSVGAAFTALSHSQLINARAHQLGAPHDSQ